MERSTPTTSKYFDRFRYPLLDLEFETQPVKTQAVFPLITSPTAVAVQAPPLQQAMPLLQRSKKQSIPKRVKEEVWNKYIGDDIPKHRCLCCKSIVIKMTDFHVGHVVSEKDGGTHAISNLRPICASCNHSMGTENMIEYAIKYGFIIGN
jgi:HNH endonuclease